MKFVHISDLHLGKRVNGFSMLEDQEYILKEILEIAKREKADAFLIAGDVYDKSVPSAEAVQVLDRFLTDITEGGISVYLISGNHDSAERLSFGSRLFQKSGKVFFSSVFGGQPECFEVEDAYGKVHIYLLPFIKPASVRPFFPDRELHTYEEAFASVMEKVMVDEKERNVLVAHQFVTGAARCESEEIVAGGVDNVSAKWMKKFDYTALGHLHGPQTAGTDRIRYCGTPLKYSFSEAGHKKSVTIVELREKGMAEIKTIPLHPLHDMRKIRGTYEEITCRKQYEHTDANDYLQITLTDEEDILNGMDRLRSIYPNLMKLVYDNVRSGNNQMVEAAEHVEGKTPLQHFEDFYELQNNQEMSAGQRSYLEKLIEKVWEQG